MKNFTSLTPLKSKPAIFLLTLLLTFTSNLFAQKFTTSLNLQLSVPQGEYKANNDNAGFGIRANFLWRPKQDLPIKLGTEIGYQSYGSRTERFDAYVYGFYERYKVSATNNVLSLTLMPRLQSSKAHKLRPFLDGIFGWNVFFSTVNVERETRYSNYDNDSYGNSSKGRWAFTYGGAAGLDIPLNKADDIGLEIKCAYLFGANSRYLTNPRIQNDGSVVFEERESETNMVIPQVGVRINL